MLNALHDIIALAFDHKKNTIMSEVCSGAVKNEHIRETMASHSYATNKALLWPQTTTNHTGAPTDQTSHHETSKQRWQAKKITKDAGKGSKKTKQR